MASSISVGTSATSLVEVPVEPDDIGYGLQDISASDSGRVQDANATMYKNRVTQKRKISLAWKNLSLKQASQIMRMFNPQYVYVRYLDVLDGTFEIRCFYVGDRSSPFRQITLNDPTGKRTTMSTLSFSIIER